ncbi:hypothetical protein [Kiritimatiella glycovorans]|uniref:Uncharacterized protein n=1 Tax=Kiritimatiella glycovorans TaxID=1307763 RepID=A0A0G3EJ03_9BACT|nr:hypothetical protein [Kiritimatiella glycovorans]AKJ64164.1 hypothetical protein L21SP4_00901 [Kiritimatiella glycovorans]
MNNDLNILRDLAKQYAAVAADPVMDERRELWRDLHDFKAPRPPIHVRQYAFSELPQSECHGEDPFHRELEFMLRDLLYAASIGDDTVFEPYLSVRAVFDDMDWGVQIDKQHTDDIGGSFKVDYVLRELEEWREKLRAPHHRIDEAATAERYERAGEAIGDILTIDLNRAPYYMHWHGDISSDLGLLRGMENFMIDMLEDPEELHALLAFMRDGVLRVQQEAEDAGDWGASATLNQASPYARGLVDPAPNRRGMKRSELFGFVAAQEFTMVSPEMQDEFLIQYQLPIMEQFGLTAYGCCEDLTRKIDILRRIPNLRRIAVTPFADVARCAEQIGTDYVMSYRPSPADMVAYGYNEERIRKVITRDLEICRGLHLDITLKDVETVEKDPGRVRKWVAYTRTIIEKM